MFIWGVSAGFANYIPIIAVVGSVAMFTIAAPALVLHFKTGLILGLIFSLFMMPFNVIYFIGVIENPNYHNLAGMLSIIPSLLNGLTLFLIMAALYRKELGITGKLRKRLLAALPVILFIIYIISIWKYVA